MTFRSWCFISLAMFALANFMLLGIIIVAWGQPRRSAAAAADAKTTTELELTETGKKVEVTKTEAKAEVTTADANSTAVLTTTG